MARLAHSVIATEKASRYLTQLAKHWSHKLVVEFDEHQARIDLPNGPCFLSAGPGSLAVLVQAETDLALENLQWAVARHLERFGYREGLKVEWAAG